MRKILIVAVSLLLAMPVAGVATFVLTPVWRWIEATTAIESIGHSGPATWCFVAVYALTVVAAFVIWYCAHPPRAGVQQIPSFARDDR